MTRSTGTLPPHFHFSVSSPKKTGLSLVAVTDDRTGFTVRTAISNEDKQVPAIMAFAGARFSRSALTAEELFEEINISQTSAQKKLANIFINYGHASVGDMAMLFAYIENVPRYLMMQFFYSTALGGGQERSSRYQDFSAATPPNIDLFVPKSLDPQERQRIADTYHQLFTSLLASYQEFLPVVEKKFSSLYRPDADTKQHTAALRARTFDTVRAFLPAGTNTSGSYITSAREWARLIQLFKSQSSLEAQYLGEQLEILFAPPETVQKSLNYLPEAPDLIRHTEPDRRGRELLQELAPVATDLATLISGRGKHPQLRRQKVRHLADLLDPTATFLYFSLVRLYPNLTLGKFVRWYQTLSGYTQRKLSGILFGSFDHHHQLPLHADTGGYTFELKMTLSEAIDFNRHRAWGRFAPILETENLRMIIRDGFQLPLYLDHPKLKKLHDAFVARLLEHYHQLELFADSLPEDVHPRLLLSLLPNAHHIRYYLSGSPKEISYLTQLRVRPGGHINYRMMAYELSRVAGNITSLLSALRIPTEQKPDPFSRDQFFDRS